MLSADVTVTLTSGNTDEATLSVATVTFLDDTLAARPSAPVSVAEGDRVPTFEDGLTTMREAPQNAAQDDAAGDPITATDPKPATHPDIHPGRPQWPFRHRRQRSITVVADDSFGYETGAGDHPMDVAVSDANGLTDKIEVKALVTDVNEPAVITGDETASLREDASIINRVTRYTAIYPGSTSFQWSVEAADGDNISIDTGGNLRFNRGPDIEIKPSHSGTIATTDNGEPEEKDAFPVTVAMADANDRPIITFANTLTPNENTDTPTILRTYAANDQESAIASRPEGATINRSVSGRDANDFDISESEALTFAEIPEFENSTDAPATFRPCSNPYSIR